MQARARIRSDGTAVADSIQYNDCMEGPITAMNRVQNTIEVMGQTVHVDDGTVFDGVTQRDINAFATEIWSRSVACPILPSTVFLDT